MMETKMSNARIEVYLDYFLALKRDAVKLQCLMDCGVDSWDGYDAAVEAYNQEVDE